MVGGGEAPPDRPQGPPPRQREPDDPWSPKKDRVVQPGAVVTLKGGKKNDE